MFFGSYSRNLDAKGRLQLPSKLVKADQDLYYVLRGFDGCIAVYPPEEFQELMKKLSSLDFRNPEDRAYVRLASASVAEMKVDSHGRILLGKALLDDYGIGKEIVLVGVLDHFEVWDATAYAKYNLANSLRFDNLQRRDS